MKYICVLITVNDIDRSRTLYQGILKQKIKSDYGENVVFASGFAIHDIKHYKPLLGSKTVNQGTNN